MLDTAINALAGRARPPLDTMITSVRSPAFPSGHAISSLAVCGAICIVIAHTSWTWPRKIACWSFAAIIVLLVGVSRLYLGVHWPTDVIGGWLLGACWLAVITIGATIGATTWELRRARAGGRVGVERPSHGRHD